MHKNKIKKYIPGLRQQPHLLELIRVKNHPVDTMSKEMCECPVSKKIYLFEYGTRFHTNLNHTWHIFLKPGSNGVCAGRVCPHGGECISTGGRGVCRCPKCSNEFAPVCGSDGISYGNRCKLQLEACRHRRHVQVLYDGPCSKCFSLFLHKSLGNWKYKQGLTIKISK